MTERKRRFLRAGAAVLALSGSVGTVAIYRVLEHSSNQNIPIADKLDSAADHLSNEPITVFDSRRGLYQHLPPTERVPAAGVLQLVEARNELREQGRNTDGVEELIDRASSARTGAQYESVSRSTQALADSIKTPNRLLILPIIGTSVAAMMGFVETFFDTRLRRPKKSPTKR